MLEASQVNFGYGTDPLFVETNLTLAPGGIYGLLGLNGAGKSTLLKLMTGLLFPDAGSIAACGYDPARRDPGFLSRVFMLPEELNVPGVTGREFVTVRSPFYPGFDRNRMQRHLEEFDIPRWQEAHGTLSRPAEKVPVVVRPGVQRLPGAAG